MLAADEIKRLLAVANEPFEDEEDNEAVAASEPRLNFATQPEAFASLDNRPAEQEAEDEEGAVAIEDALASVGAISTPEYRSPRTMGEEFSVGFDRGIDQTQGLGYGFVGLLGQAVGLEGVEEYGVENYLRKMEEAALNEASVRDPFEEIDDLGDAGLYAAGIIGEQIPQLLVSALGGGIGGLAAKTIGKRIVGNMIGKRVSAGLAGKTFADDAARAVATGNLRAKAAEDVAKETAGTLLANAGRAGGVSGAYLANFGQISGGSFGQMAQELGRGDAGIAAGFAIPGAALDTLGEVFIASKFLKPFSKAQRAAAEGVDTSLSLGRIGGGAATGFVAGSAIEGGTEYVQTGLEQAALGAADPNRTIEDVVMTPEAERERRIAGAAGATVGAPLGGVGGGFEVAFSPRTTQTLNDRARQTQTTPEEEQTTSGVLTGDWSQPIEVGGIKMQRSSTGTWAALNPPEDLDPAAPRNQLPDGTNVVVLRAAAGENNAWLINEAESALSDLNEGKFEESPPEQQNQEEQEIDEEDQLDTPAELRELEEGLGIDIPIKSAEESARTIDDAYTEEERKRQSPFALRYMERRIAVENARKERENQRMLDWGRVMAREPNESISFVNGLVKGESKVSIASLGKEPGEEGFTETTGVFAGRRNNGNAIFYISKLGPRASGPVGPNQGRIELKPEQFNRVTLARPDVDTRPLVSPFEETMRDLLGNNPSKQEAGQALGSPFTGKDAPQETTISNRMGGGPIPVLVRWFNKKGEKGTVIPTFKGKFTNSPLTTVFQMNEGLEVTVPDDQVADLSPDIQVEAVSDKKGGRKNIVTAVNLWGRTYRRGKSPSDFSVDRPLTSRGSKSRKQGLWLFDEIYRNAPERIEASEAGRRGAETRQGGPLDAQLSRVAGNIEKLDPVESTFYEDDYVRATDFLENSNLNEEEKRLAQRMAQDKIISAYEKIARSSRGAPFRTEGREQIAKRLTEVLAELRAEALADAKDKALDSIYGDVRGTREIRSAQTRVNRLTGRELGSVRQQSPARSLERLGTAQRSLTKTPNETQKQAFEDLENFLEGQALSGQSREKIEKGILDRIEKGTNAMLNKAKSRLEKELTQGLKGREKGEVVRAINQVADRYRRLKNFNPIGIATRAAFSAKRSIRRDAANAPIEPGANLEQVLQAPPPQAIGQREQAGDTQRGTGERTDASPFEALVEQEEGPRGQADAYEDGRERLFQLNEADIELVLANRQLLKNERGETIRGQKSNLSGAQKKRARQLERYLLGKLNYEDIYPNAGRGSGVARPVVADANAGQRRTGEVLSGATQSVARRAANPNPQRGSDRVGGRDQGAAGTVQGSPVQRDGGSGVPAPLDPQAVRERARRAARRFVQSFARLTDEEAAARSDVEIERARQAILNERDPAEALANRVAIGSTAASVADLASRSNADLLRGAAAEIAREQADRDAVNTARENLGALLRSGAFADANTFLDSVAANTRLPRDMAVRAKEFVKLARRGINFSNVGIQIGRFGPDTSWAGLATGADGSYNIAINLDAVHDRDSVVNTMLHELQHVVLKEKVARRIPLNRVEQEALDRLEGIRRDTVVRAARDRGLNVPDQPSNEDIARLSEELYELSNPSKENSDRALASLRNLNEFVVEVSSNPELADLMVRLGYGQGKGQVTMLGALKNAWDSLVQFITGIKADPNSPLAKAFKDSWIMSFANSGADVNLEEYTIPEVRRTAMADELAKLAEINAFIDARIQQDNLAGTTEERNRLLAEWSNQNKKSKATAPKKVKKQPPKKEEPPKKKETLPKKQQEPPKKKEEPPKKKETLPKKQQEPPKKKEEPPKKKDAPLPDDPKEQLLTFIREENRGVVKTSSGDVRAGTRIYKKVRAKDGTFKEGRGGGVSQTAHWVTRVIGDKQKTVYTLFAPIAIDGSKQDQWNEQVAYPEKEFIKLVKDGDIEVETDPQFPVGVRKEVGTGIISTMPAATQADPSTTTETNQEPLMSIAVRRVTSQDREKWRRMRLAGARARNRELDRIVDRMVDDDLPSFDSQTQREMDEASIEESADGAWQEESLSIPERYQVSIKEWREWANLIAENKVPNDPRYQSELERARRDLAGSRSGITPERLTELRLRVLDPDLQELDALDMGLQFYAGPRPILWGGPAFPNFLRDPRMRVAAQENSEVSETENFEVALDSFDKWISPAVNSENPAISNAASRLREAFIDAFGNAPLEQATGDTVQVAESRARGRVWRERVRVTPTGGTISQGGMFAVDELLDKRAGDAYRSSRMAIKADISVIQELSRLLERQMKSLYKGQTPPLETINTALGNLENPLNSQQLEEIERLTLARKMKLASKKRDQFIRDNRQKFREETQPAALAQLPEELASTIREMSSHIASLSKRLPNEGLVSGDLAITVEEALGMYLNRSYAIFDDPKWVDRVRKMPKVMDAARKFIRNSLINQKAKDLVDEAATSGRTLPFADAKRMANDSVTDADIEATLEGYLAVGDEAPSVEVLSGRIPGQKNLSMLTPRGNIAPEIQALWGRYEDPQVNYAKTVMKLSSVIANNQFLTELRDMGVEEGWLWSSKNNPDDLRHPPGYIKISSEGNPALTPLGGMYAHPMLAEGLFKMFPVGSTDQHYWWLQSAMKLTGISMAMKTVGSVASQIRNYLGNYLNLIATGNLGLGDIAPGSDFWKRFKNSNDTVLANTFNKYRNATRAEWRAKIDDYIRRGIVGESVTTGLLEDLLTASRKAGSPDFGDVVWNKVSEPFKRVADLAVKTYSSGDDWFKVMIYEAEQDKYRKAFPEWSDDQVKQKAAAVSRDIHWTYSLAPAIVQDLKKFPFVAPFVTFTTEVIRTTYNLQKLARQEIMEGRASGNKELEAMGWKRVRGMTTAAFLPAAAGATTMALAGISGEDEEDLRRFLPDWQKNSQLMLFRKENGEVSFVDVSFLDPYEYFKKPLTAFMRSLREAESADEILLGGTMAMVRQAVDPFTSEQIFAGAIMDVMRNQDAAGRQVYNPQDTGANIGTAVARKIFIEPFTPGTFTSLDRIGKAAFGVQSESGRAYGLFNELASVMAGQRVSEMDAQQALQFKGSRFMREMRDASALFNREFVSQGTRSASDVVSGYERSNGARRALVGSIRKDYLAAIRLGVPVARAKAILRDAGVGRETLRMATTGIYKPFEASEDSLSLVRARGNSDRITAYNQARRATPTKEVLP